MASLPTLDLEFSTTAKRRGLLWNLWLVSTSFSVDSSAPGSSRSSWEGESELPLQPLFFVLDVPGGGGGDVKGLKSYLSSELQLDRRASLSSSVPQPALDPDFLVPAFPSPKAYVPRATLGHTPGSVGSSSRCYWWGWTDSPTCLVPWGTSQRLQRGLEARWT